MMETKMETLGPFKGIFWGSIGWVIGCYVGVILG